MSKARALICDDDPKRSASWAASLASLQSVTSAFDVREATMAEMIDGVETLQERRKGSRDQRRKFEDTKTCFDGIELLLVDYDLLAYDRLGVDTGERVAYLARCYSDCGYIVELNQFGDLWFDLTLRDHPVSYADLNLGGGHVANPGLWSEPFSGFRPWYWPLIPMAVKQFSRRIVELEGHLDDVIVDYLGVPESVVALLPRALREDLGPDAAASFRDFIRDSPLGLRPGDKLIDEDAMTRVAAARVAKWLEWIVLPNQDFLIDAPHLVRRLPSLLGQKATQKALDSVVKLSGAPSALKSETRIQPLERETWLSRPVWWWTQIITNEDIEEVSRPWGSGDIEFEFCEDASRFLLKADVREFVADLPTPLATRFVISPSSEYAKRFSAPARRDPRGFKGVSYRPTAWFVR